MSEEIKSYSKSVNQVDKDIKSLENRFQFLFWISLSRYSRGVDTHHIAIILLTRCAKMGYLKLDRLFKAGRFKKFNTGVGFKQTSSCIYQMLLIMSPPIPILHFIYNSNKYSIIETKSTFKGTSKTCFRQKLSKNNNKTITIIF